MNAGNRRFDARKCGRERGRRERGGNVLKGIKSGHAGWDDNGGRQDKENWDGGIQVLSEKSKRVMLTIEIKSK